MNRRHDCAGAAGRGFAVLAFLLLTIVGPVMAETFRIEIDYMVSDGAVPHSHMPTAEEVQAVQRMFACQGHTLIIEVSDAIPHWDVLQYSSVSGFFDYDVLANTFGALKAEWQDHAGEAGWHYCIFGHQYAYPNSAGDIVTTGSSGLAELNGDDLLVSLGNFVHDGLPTGSPFHKAATLAHEFGHNLGLSHCGAMVCGKDDTLADYVGPFVPNLPSVMSYVFQLRGVQTNLVCQGLATDAALFKDMDYSHGTMCSLDENSLDEGWGTMLRRVDWNCNGTVGGVSVVNVSGGDDEGWCAAAPGAMTLLDDYDEWANIVDSTKSKTSAELKRLPVETCISAEEMAALTDKAVCPDPDLVIEACVTAETRYVRSGGSASGDGSCEDPMGGVAQALTGAPEGSLLVLEPGTWGEGALILASPVVLLAPSPAVIR